MLCFPSFHIMELWHLFDEVELAWFFAYLVFFYLGKVLPLLILVKIDILLLCVPHQSTCRR